MKLKQIYIIMAAAISFAYGCSRPEFIPSEFANPDICWRPIPLWFWNDAEVTEEGITSQLEMMIGQDGYGGCAILPFGEGFRPEYLSDEYFTLYQKAISIVKSYGGRMSLYDEYGFPSGSIGAKHGDGIPRLMNRYPGKTLKRLDKEELECPSGGMVTADIPDGTLMAVTAVNRTTGEVRDIRSFIEEGTLKWAAPEDGISWTVMFFVCRIDGDPNVDYLSSEAVKLFINETHEEYFKRFPEEFGSTITSTFFDEPTMYRCEGRMWTDDFNASFTEAYGIQPDCLYPHLWYDLGNDTPQARCMMFGHRSRLYSEGFMKTIAEWSTEHHILSTGHQDQEEILNTSSISGDLLLCGSTMTMPGIDKIGGDRPAERFYKVVSSSAYNWDHDAVMSETFGAMGNIPFSDMYKIAIEQYTKGITDLIPHAVWYDDSHVTFLPELSGRNPLYAEGLPDFNRFLSRLRYILARPGQHVADIAVLYPVQTQYAGHHLDGPLSRYEGGVKVPGTDYDRISAILTDTLGRDFAYIHPDVLNERCTVEDGGEMILHNVLNTETFNTIILPGVKVIDVNNLRIIREAAESGANVIFTTSVPSLSATSDATDTEIAEMAAGMVENGLAVFVGSPDAAALSEALIPSEMKADVLFTGEGHPLNYIHKRIGRSEVFYFGNINDSSSECTVSLLGKKGRGMLMNPHTGTATPLTATYHNGRTEFKLNLDEGESMFAVFQPTQNSKIQ